LIKVNRRTPCNFQTAYCRLINGEERECFLHYFTPNNTRPLIASKMLFKKRIQTKRDLIKNNKKVINKAPCLCPATALDKSHYLVKLSVHTVLSYESAARMSYTSRHPIRSHPLFVFCPLFNFVLNCLISLLNFLIAPKNKSGKLIRRKEEKRHKGLVTFLRATEKRISNSASCHKQQQNKIKPFTPPCS